MSSGVSMKYNKELSQYGTIYDGKFTAVGVVKDFMLTVGVDVEKINKSVQTWYGAYSLPAQVHACPKDYDILTYNFIFCCLFDIPACQNKSTSSRMV